MSTSTYASGLQLHWRYSPQCASGDGVDVVDSGGAEVLGGVSMPSAIDGGIVLLVGGVSTPSATDGENEIVGARVCRGVVCFVGGRVWNAAAVVRIGLPAAAHLQALQPCSSMYSCNSAPGLQRQTLIGGQAVVVVVVVVVLDGSNVVVAVVVVVVVGRPDAVAVVVVEEVILVEVVVLAGTAVVVVLAVEEVNGRVDVVVEVVSVAPATVVPVGSGGTSPLASPPLFSPPLWSSSVTFFKKDEVVVTEWGAIVVVVAVMAVGVIVVVGASAVDVAGAAVMGVVVLVGRETVDAGDLLDTHLHLKHPATSFTFSTSSRLQLHALYMHVFRVVPNGAFVEAASAAPTGTPAKSTYNWCVWPR